MTVPLGETPTRRALVSSPERRHAPAARRRRRRWRVPGGGGAAAGCLLIAAYLLGAFWQSVQTRSPRASYQSPLAGQAWIRSPEAGPRAFFRLDLPITTMPQSATLFVQGDQAVTPFINGYRLAPPPKLPPGIAILKAVQALDVLPGLERGMNTIGLEVVNLYNGTPSFQAKVVLHYGNRIVSYGRSPSSWRSTTNVGLTDEAFPESGSFSMRDLATPGWQPATRAPPFDGVNSMTVPPDAFTAPPLRPAIAGVAQSGLLTAFTTVEAPKGCTEAWLRIAASGPYTVALDGEIFARGLGGESRFGAPLNLPGVVNLRRRPIGLTAFDICPYLHPGADRLAVSVAATSPSTALAYVDGMIDSGTGVTTFGSGPGWQLRSGGSLTVVDAPNVALHRSFYVAFSPTAIPPDLSVHLQLVDGLWVVLAELALISVAVLVGARTRRAIAYTAIGVLPAVTLVLLLDQSRHLVTTEPPFPSTPAMLATVAVVFVAGGTAAAVAASAQWPRSVRSWSARLLATIGVHRARGLHLRPPGDGMWRSCAGWLRRHSYAVGVGTLIALVVSVLSFQINWDPLWEDELDSLIAAQGIRAHLIPVWPSGFEYWKSELYSASLAVVGVLSHNNLAADRALSVALFAGTVLLVAFYLLPMVLPGRRGLQLLAVATFALAPAEETFARDIRMYQMVQFFVVLVAILFARALEKPSSRRIAAAMAAFDAMYLAHEVSFGVLLIVPLGLFAFYGLSWISNWRWWLFGGLAASVIVVQLALAVMTHPPAFGVDPSGGPLVAWSPQPFWYLENVFFTPSTDGGGITVISWLALLGLVVGLRRRSRSRIYLAAFWLVPTAVLALMLPTKNARYVFICIPFVFVLAAAGTGDLVDWGRRRLGQLGSITDWSRAHLLVTVAGAMAFAAVVVSTFNGLTDLGPLAASLFDANLAHYQYDYGRADAYVKAHLRPGDAVIAAAPGNLIEQGTGKPPTYWMSYYSKEVLLYIFEKNGRAVDTQFGSPAIVDDAELVRAIDAHSRVWLVISDTNVINGLSPQELTTIASRFKLVENGEDTSVFLATDPISPAARSVS